MQSALNQGALPVSLERDISLTVLRRMIRIRHRGIPGHIGFRAFSQLMDAMHPLLERFWSTHQNLQLYLFGA
jgi:hypothetical protein